MTRVLLLPFINNVLLFAPLGVLFVVARWRDFFSNFAGFTSRIERVTVTRVRLRNRASSDMTTTDIYVRFFVVVYGQRVTCCC